MKRPAPIPNGAAAADAGAGSVPGARSRATAMARLLLAGVLGIAHTQAFAPHDWWWLQILSLAGLAALMADAPRARIAAATGYAFGLGWFLSGIWWLYISMHVYGEMPAWMAALAVVLFSGYLALWPALAGGLWHRLTARLRAGTWAAALLAPLAFGAAWGLSEWLRGVVFTGFPWLSGGYAHTDGPLAGFAPLVGVYGIGALAAAVAALLAGAVRGLGHGARTRAVVSLALALLLPALGAALSPLAWTTPAGKPLTVRLLQGNVPQDIKFEAAGIQRSIALYRDMITAAPADLVVTPETAFPVILQELPVDVAVAVRDYALQSGTTVLFGAAGADSPVDFTNSVFGLGPLTERLYRYNKHHLVPFGEFIPLGFRWFVDMMKMPLGDFRRGGLDQPSLPVRGVRVAPNICYEDLFGEEIAQTLRQQPAPANVLANLTNLAWFGDTIALDQHLQISRMRALETRRPMLRSTNTGMTAVVRPDGTVQARLPTFTTGTLVAEVQGMQGLTPYIRWGNAPVLALFALVLGAAAWRARRAG
ncbi:apolipoprotein N-acyltransferase [Cupriavidus oxalaticus]|jgi:apolipoprotein N-acyltransferase|uniref:Apolipoprotein N-acyltransferase n=1 Tax=Cupriavidus oxalaticus TaxID=96344 RepID=A0A375FSZ4_9BURK|nr:apolipoprotein N-acyltransferase [Cupriavidus oxalaticus]QRQ86943.1 apolipoprotein N-acyltransferase [Cupriavidus oxalaticus]QRQ94729.1 apolipoprotein N-acyltransferase [Cupriavidus oxalaticus]WQD83378.1 apolipoprotein N-acyltransferase [Cupriavidus oxalaticus]SPC07338.1 apolipoprotein N-acyltransferase, copper homeostasis protein [Cupriavidus oxalaticus]SPC16148.1 Apolipoprotein N-acyltransferase [Cupriavidus oxalaticus]